MIAVFTDGACSGNPGPGGWACVIATPDGRARELAGGAESTTNNRMELTAVIRALRAMRSLPDRIIMHTDSSYVLGGVTRWLGSWKRRGWRTAVGKPIKNEELWRELDALAIARGLGGVEWRWVRGHSGHDANERCDALAVALSRRRPVSLYDGPLLAYPHGSLTPTPAQPIPEGPRRRRSETAPVVYLSLVTGRLERHESWKQCEARVKGRSGARFKKVRSPAEERAALHDWGLLD